MTVPAGSAPGAEDTGGSCVLCGIPVATGTDRCAACGMVLPSPSALSRPELVAIGAVFAGIYVVTVVLVAAAR